MEMELDDLNGLDRDMDAELKLVGARAGAAGAGQGRAHVIRALHNALPHPLP